MDSGLSVQETTDGGYVVAGETNFGYENALLAKYFLNGTLEWASALSGSGTDHGESVQQTTDEGFIVAGVTTSFGVGNDVLLAKFSSNGTLEWASTLDGGGYDWGHFVQQTTDGGFIVTGYTKNFVAGGFDVLLAKYFPNGTMEWASTLDGIGNSVQQATDGGFIITGRIGGDVLLAKFFPNGSSEWTSTLDGGENEEGKSVRQTTDGGFIVTGYTTNYYGDGKDVLLAVLS